ncbi:hypothetical protein ANCDUO_09768, partial [Ancylostoma duodenale]
LIVCSLESNDTQVRPNAVIILAVVSENVEELSNPLHEAARRGNLLFLKECIGNQDAEIAGLIDQAMRRDTKNEDCDNEYESGSDKED